MQARSGTPPSVLKPLRVSSGHDTPIVTRSSPRSLGPGRAAGVGSRGGNPAAGRTAVPSLGAATGGGPAATDWARRAVAPSLGRKREGERSPAEPEEERLPLTPMGSAVSSPKVTDKGGQGLQTKWEGGLTVRGTAD